MLISYFHFNYNIAQIKKMNNLKPTFYNKTKI
jgi:hypothetical protein